MLKNRLMRRTTFILPQAREQYIENNDALDAQILNAHLPVPCNDMMRFIGYPVHLLNHAEHLYYTTHRKGPAARSSVFTLRPFRKRS